MWLSLLSFTQQIGKHNYKTPIMFNTLHSVHLCGYVKVLRKCTDISCILSL